MKKIITLVFASAFFLSQAQTTQTFNYTGSLQTFVVPPCVTSLTIEAYGAQGNTATYGPPPAGGLGAYINGTFTVTPGQTLNIMVGQMGLMGIGGCGDLNGGGGGGSFVWDPTNTTNPLVAAGGGGGSGSCGNSPGGPGLATLGGPGLGGNCGNCNNGNGTGGGGAGWNGNGMGCKSSAGCGAAPPALSPLSGGTGGTPWIGDCFQNGAGGYGSGGAGGGNCGGGGGGGGYSGGNAAGNTLVCSGDNSYGGTSYNVGTAQTNTSGVRTGNGQVILTYTAGSGVPNQPGTITGPNSVCAGATASYSISTVVGATSYSWTVPVGAVINSGNGTTSINVTWGTTSGNVSVVANNACGASTAQTLAVTVNPLPVVNLGPPITACASVLLDAQNAGSAYLWSTTATTQTITVTTSGSYTVTVTSTAGCSATGVVDVTINTPPTVALGADITQCGGTATLDALNPGATYLWSNAATTQTIVVSTTGTYSVTVTDANGCTATDVIVVTINSNPVVTLSLNPTITCVTWTAYALTGGSPSGGTYSGTGVTANMFDPSAAGQGSFTITYVFTDINGCIDSAQQNITVDLCTGINGASSLESVVLYPNPAQNELYIETNSDVTIVIVDEIGKTVFSQQLIKGKNVINTSALASGVYQVALQNENGIAVKKLVINK